MPTVHLDGLRAQKKGRLSSQIVATSFVSDNAPWEDALPNAVFPDADKKRQSVCPAGTRPRGNQKRANENLRHFRQRRNMAFMLEFLDTNWIIFAK